MSAGPTQRGTYETEDDTLVKCRLQPETLTLTIEGVSNAIPAGSPDLTYPSATISQGLNANGIQMRRVRFSFTGTPPAGYSANQVITLPWFTKSTFPPIKRDAVGTYNPDGVAPVDIRVVGKSAERIN